MFSNAIKLFAVRGFDIKVDPSWILIALLITWTLAGQYFPSVFPDQPRQIYVVMGIIAMLVFFVSLLLHELAHSFVARRYGVRIKGITLFLFGGVAELEQEVTSAGAEFWIALAGPAMSFALSLVFWLLMQFMILVADAPQVSEILSYLAIINFVIAVFNLVPAFPLDGGRVLRAYLWHRSGDVVWATRMAAMTGNVFAYGLMFLGLLALLQGILITGFWYIMIGIFIMAAARSAYQTKLMQKTFANKTAGGLMIRDPVVVSPDLTLAEFFDKVLLEQRISFVPVVESGILLGQIDKSVLSAIERDNWETTHVGDVFEGLDRANIVPPDMPIPALMERIAKSGHRKFLVAEDHKLLGVITLANLFGYLQAADEDARHAHG